MLGKESKHLLKRENQSLKESRLFFMQNKVIITCALTGAQQGKESNPNLPEQPDEIITQAVDAWNAGASIVHIHARDKNGKATSDVSIFREIVDGIKKSKCDVVLNLTTGGAVAGLPLEERLKVIPEIKPDIASFSIGGGSLLGSYDFEKKRWQRDRFVQLFRSYEEIQKTLEIFRENKVKPELEVYDTGFLNNVITFQKIGLLNEPLLVNFVMGIPGECTLPTVKNLLHLVESLPKVKVVWHVSAIGGKTHFQMLSAAVAMGGHIRTGMEDNIYISKGKLAKSNAEIVEKVVRILREMSIEIATPSETRQILGLN